MTVAELIEKLQALDPDMEVHVGEESMGHAVAWSEARRVEMKTRRGEAVVVIS